jgi:hypothetical protein
MRLLPPVHAVSCCGKRRGARQFDLTPTAGQRLQMLQARPRSGLHTACPLPTSGSLLSIRELYKSAANGAVPQVLIADHRREAASLKAELGALKQRYLERKRREQQAGAAAPALPTLPQEASPPAPAADAGPDMHAQGAPSPRAQLGYGPRAGQVAVAGAPEAGPGTGAPALGVLAACVDVGSAVMDAPDTRLGQAAPAAAGVSGGRAQADEPLSTSAGAPDAPGGVAAVGPAGEHAVSWLVDGPEGGRAVHSGPDAEDAAGSGEALAVAGAAAEQEGMANVAPPHALPLGAAGAGPE